MQKMLQAKPLYTQTLAIKLLLLWREVRIKCTHVSPPNQSCIQTEVLPGLNFDLRLMSPFSQVVSLLGRRRPLNVMTSILLPVHYFFYSILTLRWASISRWRLFRPKGFKKRLMAILGVRLCETAP